MSAVIGTTTIDADVLIRIAGSESPTCIGTMPLTLEIHAAAQVGESRSGTKVHMALASSLRAFADELDAAGVE